MMTKVIIKLPPAIISIVIIIDCQRLRSRIRICCDCHNYYAHKSQWNRQQANDNRQSAIDDLRSQSTDDEWRLFEDRRSRRSRVGNRESVNGGIQRTSAIGKAGKLSSSTVSNWSRLLVNLIGSAPQSYPLCLDLTIRSARRSSVYATISA